MKDREAVCEKVRAVGLIYQQSVEGDSREPEMKKARRSEPKTQKAPAFAEALNFFFNGEHTMPIVMTN
ncbi:TPA: hypothetical protein MIQ23_23320 [Klebsiella pneumoniae]|nr:hypothetical protein CXB26_06795 [Klebsiella pneumoniae]AUD27527.1 hypothetical protein CXB24_06790 [Klebsiella pneumoniae]AUD33079.1 hypothetical protein CXB25_06790 [Klebsiella pneumoniae]HBY1171351.1 hypothetical protein [Klebsiella pneumoniae]HBY1182543.1 hypothetical protein [Klebsiella pneumoniae]